MAWNYFDYVDNSEIWLKDFVMAATLIRKSETWKKKDNEFFIICGLDIPRDKIFCLMFSDLNECINASRSIYKALHEHKSRFDISVMVTTAEIDDTVLDEVEILNDANEFVSSYINNYLGGMKI
ncbi:hypothetical protein [Enterococcus cecorum]|uniref:hypothetical protein n=1 Tax=Enterococcus cecorum TaxID=44008 RepID=UPI00148CD5B7|nr:hypothetical protein [Enterococcus cecorum]